MDQSESDLSHQLETLESRLGNKETGTGESEENYDFEAGRIFPSSPTEAEFGDSPSDRAEEMTIEDACDINWEEDVNFSTPCETDLGVIPLPSSTNYDEIHVPPPAESPNFNADLEYLFSTDQNGDVLNPSPPGVCGLCNLGNTCFMNSGLQCLLNTPTMVQFFMKQISEDTANPDSLATHFTNLFHKVWSGTYSKVKPKEFHQALGVHHSQFKDYRQHDCQEFLALVLGSLHELLNTASSKSHVSDLSADPMTPHSTCEEDRDSSGPRNVMQETADHDSGSQVALSIAGLRCEASSSSHSSESSIGASQIRMRPLPEDVQPFKSFHAGGSILWEAMDSFSEGVDNSSPPVEADSQVEEASISAVVDNSGSNIILDNALKKDLKSLRKPDKSKLEKNEVASLNNIPQCFRGYEDILKDAKTSNVNVLVTEQGANNEIVFDSEKFPKYESTRRRDALENPNLTEFHNFDGKTVSVKRIKETNKLHDHTENAKDFLTLETFYNSNNKRFKLEESLEKEKNFRMEYERKLCDDSSRLDQDGARSGEFSGATAMNSPINLDDDLEADKQWEKHLGHNQSVIVDSFQGQFKSTVVCSECRYVSSTYEPFMYLSLPLPHAMEQQICVTFVPANSNPPTKFLLTLNKQDKIVKIKEHLRKVMKANVSMSLELAEVLHHHIARILDENLFIRYLGTSDPHRSIYAFEIPEDAISASPSLKENFEGCQTSEPLDLTPEQGPLLNVLESSNETVKLNNVETRRISRQSESESKSNISSTINNNLKEESSVSNLVETQEIGPVFYGPHLEHQGGGDAWITEKSRPMDLTSGDKDDWKSCAICLEEVEKGLKNHKGCSCFLCDICIQRSITHYDEGEDNELMKCPVCNELVDPNKVFIVADGNTELRSSVRMLKIPVLFRLDIEGEGNNNEKCQKLFGHPHLIKVANRLKGSQLYEIVGKLIPYSNCYSIVLVDGQGYHCSRCMYTVHCKGCKISEDSEINLQTGDNLAVRFTSSVVEIPAVEHHSLKNFRSQEQLSIYDCLDAFSESETLDEHNPWYCPTCQRNQCATKTLSVWRYPDFLIVYLKRFVFHEYTSVKLDDKVSFPLTGLNLVPPSRIQQGTSRPYNLYACVNHFGGASAGHYTAYAKNPQSGDWHLFNDETVTAQKPQEEDFCNAYVLFYQKQGTSLPNFPAFIYGRCNLSASRTLQSLSSLKLNSNEVKIQKVNSLLRRYFLRLRARDPNIRYSEYYRIKIKKRRVLNFTKEILKRVVKKERLFTSPPPVFSVYIDVGSKLGKMLLKWERNVPEPTFPLLSIALCSYIHGNPDDHTEKLMNVPNSFLNDATAKPNIEQLILDLDSSVEQDTWHENIAQSSAS